MALEDIGPTGIWQSEYKPHMVSERMPLAITAALEDQFTSVLDLGCGNGVYLREFAWHGKHCTGVEGAVPRNTCFANILEHDITKPLPATLARHELVLCLEVAEHIPAAHTSGLLANIRALAERYVVLSWAVPGQAGLGHVHCLSNRDAIVLVERECGLRFLEQPTARLRTYLMGDLPHCGWFQCTCMVFGR